MNKVVVAVIVGVSLLFVSCDSRGAEQSLANPVSGDSLVAARIIGIPLWEQSDSRGSSLSKGVGLFVNEYLASPQRKYALVNQDDGNIVIYNMETKAVIWETKTSRTAYGISANLIFQTDGNLVVYSSKCSNVWAWQSQSYNRGGEKLIMQDDGNLVIYNASGSAVWNSRASYGYRLRTDDLGVSRCYYDR